MCPDCWGRRCWVSLQHQIHHWGHSRVDFGSESAREEIKALSTIHHQKCLFCRGEKTNNKVYSHQLFKTIPANIDFDLPHHPPTKILWVIKMHFDFFFFNTKYFIWICCRHMGQERKKTKKRLGQDCEVFPQLYQENVFCFEILQKWY